MYNNVRCTYTEMYISDFSKNLSKMFQIYSELCLMTYHPCRYGQGKLGGPVHVEGRESPDCRLISERD
jgi:hypothetical protein